MTKINVGIHKDHRQRLKDKAIDAGLKNFADHEVLELLLFYVIPYKDTNPIAHTLISHFGSLNGVLSADLDSLMAVPGIGKETARYINIIKQLMERYLNPTQNLDIFIHSTSDVVKYFRQRYMVTSCEMLYVVCVNKMGRLIKILTYDGLDEVEINVNLNQIHRDIINSGATQVFLIHTHPDGDIQPSAEDIALTKDLVLRCYSSRVNLHDHLIFNGYTHRSMLSEIKNFKEEKGIDISVRPGINNKFNFK